MAEGLTPAVVRSSQEESVAEGLLPAVERPSEEAYAAVVGTDGQDPWTLEPDGTRDQVTSASDGRLEAAPRTMVVERSSGEETVTTGMRVGQRPSVEAEPATSRMSSVERPSEEQDAADIVSDSHSAIGAHPPVDLAPTGVPATDDALTEPS